MDKYPEITFAIENKFKKLNRDKLTPWVFLNAGNKVSIVDFYGHAIQYQGVRFEGSPREVFWGGFVEPFLEDIFVWAFELALDRARKRNSDSRELILYTRECLTNGVNLIYKGMQKIDRNLRGNGFPDKITPRNISREINKMQIKLDEYRDSTLVASKIKNEQTASGKFTDVVELKPGIFGFSFDLKKLWKWCMLKLGY
ncbi:MAG: hypothetical protein WAO71_07235 [Gallionella sp.]